MGPAPYSALEKSVDVLILNPSPGNVSCSCASPAVWYPHAQQLVWSKAAWARVRAMAREGGWGTCPALPLHSRLEEAPKQSSALKKQHLREELHGCPGYLSHLLCWRIQSQEGASGLANPESQLRYASPGPESCTLIQTRVFGILSKRNQITTLEKLAQQFLLKLQVPCGRLLGSSGSCLLMRLPPGRPR